MSKDLALGVVIGGAIGASFGRAMSETGKSLDNLKSRAEKTRGLQGLIGETIRLREQMTATARDGAAGLQRLHDAHERNIARLREHGVATRNLGAEYQRLERTARNLKLIEEGRAQIGAGLDQVRQGVQVGGAVAATATVPTMVAANYQAIIRDIAIKGGIARTGEEKQLAETIRAAALDNGMERNQLAEAVNQLVAGGMEIKDAAGLAALLAKFSVGQKAESTDVAAMVLALKQAGVSDPKAMEQALGKIAVAGDLGAFEANNMAKHFAGLMPQLTGFGMAGDKGAVALAAMLQTQMAVTNSPDEAANNLKNLLSKITADDTKSKFEKQGIDYEASMQAAITKGYDPVSAFIGLIEQSMQKTDPAKAKQLAEIQEQIAKSKDPAQQQKMLDGYLAMAGLTSFISDQQAKQAALAAIQNKAQHQANLQLIESTDGVAKIEKDLTDRRTASKNLWGEVGQAFDDAMLQIGDAIRPLTDMAATGLKAAAGGIASLVEAFPGLASGVLGLGAAIAATMAAIGAGKVALGALKVGAGLLGMGGKGGKGSMIGGALDAVTGGKAGALLGGDTQQVFVTNWPGGAGIMDSITGKTRPAGKAGGGLLGKGMDLLGRHGGKLGGAVAIGSALMGVYNTATTATTRDEKAEGYGGAAGTLAGGLAGAKAGALVGAMGGPIGIALGGLIGGAIGSFGGDKLGGWIGKGIFGGGDKVPAQAAAVAAAKPETPAPPPPPAPSVTFSPSIAVTVQGDVKDPRALAGELMPHLKRMFDQFQAQQQRAQLYDAAHV